MPELPLLVDADDACVKCGGTGYVEVNDDGEEIPFACNRCYGSGKEPPKPEPAPVVPCSKYRLLAGFACSDPVTQCPECPERTELG